jgi:Xaa-Pro aminopeptidase
VEKHRLNDYHAMVFEKIAPLLNEEEAAFLKKYTRAI